MTVSPAIQTNWTPAVTYVRSVFQPGLPQVRPVDPLETTPAVPVEPRLALRSWLSHYSNPKKHSLFQRIAADPSPEGTIFRRGFMISGLVGLIP